MNLRRPTGSDKGFSTKDILVMLAGDNKSPVPIRNRKISIDSQSVTLLRETTSASRLEATANASEQVIAQLNQNAGRGNTAMLPENAAMLMTWKAEAIDREKNRTVLKDEVIRFIELEQRSYAEIDKILTQREPGFVKKSVDILNGLEKMQKDIGDKVEKLTINEKALQSKLDDLLKSVTSHLPEKDRASIIEATMPTEESANRTKPGNN